MKPTIKATIASAVKLSSAQIKKITDVVKAKYSDHTVELKEVVDSSLIGGIKITVGSQQWDATIYSSLEKIHQSLKQSL
jgi:F-type H+-transporting ATPase subunit delta